MFTNNLPSSGELLIEPSRSGGRWGFIRSLLHGASTVLSLSSPPRTARFGETLLGRSDSEALYGDWCALGADMDAAMGVVVGEVQAAERRVDEDSHEPAAR